MTTSIRTSSGLLALGVLLGDDFDLVAARGLGAHVAVDPLISIALPCAIEPCHGSPATGRRGRAGDQAEDGSSGHRKPIAHSHETSDVVPLDGRRGSKVAAAQSQLIL